MTKSKAFHGFDLYTVWQTTLSDGSATSKYHVKRGGYDATSISDG